ncbi:non-reducing end alpha-L-arabinofuranosidase family hydrolase [Saccharothrix variisporea]|uniref:non-reducing end alpha-L-arabinofuranosidase n=1 Tax=Saccharothrix variisporea TaxID=543527 RepID=A0A495X5G8_9PSEU|nr:non-reducing end alpha-L-arabinofuranosidase family hydrolase [Saccharothrix variisporea]RKT67863.1 cellulose binding domain-containing protein [Saccharothrix variisporea]
MLSTRRFASRRATLAAAALAPIAAVSVLTAVSAPASAAPGCSVAYTASQWQGGFTANVAITNVGDAVNGWTLTWSYPAGQKVTQAWNADVAQSGTQVTAKNVSYNASIPTGGKVEFGFNGSWTGSNPAPESFSLNGTPCTGGVVPTSTTTTVTTTTDSHPPTGSLPSSFRWNSSGILISPKPDATHANVAVKDPSVVYYNGKYHVFASTYTNGYNLMYTSFTDWSQASSAPHYYLDTTAIGSGYKAAPQVFYFAPQRLWYLVYQTGDNASYSTTTDISNPSSWSAPKNFYAGGMPQIIRDNIGNGYWVDFWMICDSAKCYLFSSDDNGHLYRSETTLGQFPNGFTNTVIALRDADKNRLFEASNVYKIAGKDQWLLVHEAIGTDGRRYFRSWTAPAITGPWTGLADTEANPFARHNNVTFPGGAWTRDISHGEVVRTNVDQTMEISPCKLSYLYQGLDPNAGGEYNRLPWRLGLLTQTNSTC